MHLNHPGDASGHWSDRPWVSEALCFAFGACVLFLISLSQKLLIGVDPMQWRGYILPVGFGGTAMALIGYYQRLSRRHFRAQLQMESHERQRFQEIEEALRESRDHLETAQRIGHVGSWVSNLVTDEMTWSAEALRIFGTDAERFSGTRQAYYELIHPDDRKEVGAAVKRALADGSYDVVHRIITSAGGVRWIHARGEVDFDEKHTPLRMHGMMHDITERKVAENALRLAKERFQDFAEVAADWFWETNADDRFTFVSENVPAPLAPIADRLIGMNRMDLPGFDADKQTLRTHRALVEAREGYRKLLYSISQDDGAPFWIEVSAKPVFGPDGEFLGYRGSGQDVTKQQESELALRRSKNRFSLAMRGANDGLWDWNLETNDVYYSPRWCSMLGYKPDELEPSLDTWAKLVHPEDKDRVLEAVQDYINGVADGFDTEFRMRHKDGSWVDILSRAFLSQEDGDPMRLVGTHVDITARKDAEKALRESEERFRSILENATDAIAIITADGRYRYLSPSTSAVLGYEPEELVGRNVIDFTHPDDVASRQEALSKVTEVPDAVVVEEFRFRHKNGTWRTLISTKKNALCVPGIGGILANARDVTERRAAEEELERYRNQLEELVDERTAQVQEKSQQLEEALDKEKEYNLLQQKFVSLVSHEFRTPLAIIDGSAQRLIRRKDKAAPEEIATRLEKVRSAILRLTGLIDLTLYTTRLDAGNIGMNPATCDLRDLVREVCERQAEISPEYEFVVDIDALPEDMFADKNLLDMVFTNLLSNAVKYSPDNKTIQVTGSLTDGEVRVSVSDSGVGIPKEDMPHMFKRFFRARTSEGYRGTGVGLNVSREFVEMHGGRIELQSTVGKGSTFTVHLPRNAQEAQREAAATAKPAA